MSNICYSDWVIEGEPSEIQDLYKKLTVDIPNNEYAIAINRYDYTNEWLGNVVACFGGHEEFINCYGTYYDVKIDDKGNLTFSTYTDNNDMAETWYFVCSKYSTLKPYYYSEETAASGIWTNDKEGKYFEAGWELRDYEDPDFYKTKEEVMHHLSELLGKPITTLTDIDKEIKNYNNNQKGIEVELKLTEIFLVDEEGTYIGPDLDYVKN